MDDNEMLTDDDLDQNESDFILAMSGVTFELHYSRSPKPREFFIGGLTGPKIDNAYNEGRTQTPGDWEHPDMILMGGENVDWRRECFVMALSEAIHEACEWFQVDGVPLIDPHGCAEDFIHKISAETAKRIYDHRMSLKE